MHDELISELGRLLQRPERPGREFIMGGATYGMVHSMAADLLASCSRDDGARLCLCTEDRGLMAAALLASLAGGPSLILPYAFSRQAVAEVHESLPFSLAITDREDLLPRGVASLRPHASGKKDTLEPAEDPDRVFLSLFTGGSTGRPKVWSKTAMNIFGEAIYHRRTLELSANDIFLATVPAHHIYGLLFSVAVPLVSSASVIGSTPVFPAEIAAAIENEHPTIFVSVPVHYRILRNSQVRSHCLRFGISSAGALDAEDADAFYRVTGVGVLEVYGSTETGGIATRCRADGETSLTPFGGLEWKIEDSLLCVKSGFLSRDLSLDRDGFFVTGDRAEPLGDGTFSLLGRADGIIKVGGRRVDLAELKAKIMKIPGVRDTFLISRESGRGRGTDVLALVEGDIPEPELWSELQERVEPYEQPRRIRIVDRIPVLSTGKYDRQAIEKILNS